MCGRGAAKRDRVELVGCGSEQSRAELPIEWKFLLLALFFSVCHRPGTSTKRVILVANVKELSLEELLAEQQRHQNEGSLLEQKIRAKRQENATKDYNEVVALLESSAEFFTPKQRNTIASMVGGVAAGNAGSVSGTKVKKSKAEGSGSSKEYKYQLDTGETWTGLKRRKDAFKNWDESAEGRAWKAANPGQRYPAYPNPNAPKVSGEQ